MKNNSQDGTCHEADSGNLRWCKQRGNTPFGPWRLRNLAAWLPVGLALLGSLSAPPCTAQGLPRSLSFLNACGDDDNADASNGPVRMARLAYRQGQVTWREGTATDWSPVGTNMPLRQGAQIYVADNSRAEVQFDDGSRMRLRGNTLVTLQTLYSDDQGEFTEITLNEGTIYLRLKNKYSVYQVNTPSASLKAVGPANLRIDADAGAKFTVRKGSATVEGSGGSATLTTGESLALADSQSPYQPQSLPHPDAWDSWNDTRDRHYDQMASDQASYLPPNIGLVGDDLDDYGTWHDDPQYGHVWHPRVSGADWRPYRAGHWTWVEPFGWTWVGDEPWGWAPYHYGTWVHEPSGWGWCPGPSTQYWSPAVVSYTQDRSDVAWCPLAPTEVRYPPALSVGFRGGEWSTFFSIGAAAVYYPTAAHYCVARPWQNTYVNHVTYVNNVTNITNVYNSGTFVNRNTYFGGRNFVPVNAQYLGATHTSLQNFAGRAAYQPVTRANVGMFSRGRAVGAPANGARALAGPPAVRVTRQALTATRTFQPASRVQQQMATRAVYRSPFPANVPRAVATTLPGQRFTAARTTIGPGSRITPGRVTAGAAAAGMGAAALRAAHNNGMTHVVPGTVNRPPLGHPAGRVPASASSGLRTYLQQRRAGSLPAKNAPSRPSVPASRTVGNHALPGATTRPGSNPAAHPVAHTAQPASHAVSPPNRAVHASPPMHRTPMTASHSTPAASHRTATLIGNAPSRVVRTPRVQRNIAGPHSEPRSHPATAVRRTAPAPSTPSIAPSPAAGNPQRPVARPNPTVPRPAISRPTPTVTRPSSGVTRSAPVRSEPARPAFSPRNVRSPNAGSVSAPPQPRPAFRPPPQTHTPPAPQTRLQVPAPQAHTQAPAPPTRSQAPAGRGGSNEERNHQR